MSDKQKYKLFDVVLLIFMIGVILVILYPLWFVVIASVSEPSLVGNGEVTLYPKGFTLLGYQKIIEEPSIWTGYWNAIVYTGLYTFFGLLFILPAAYALSRKGLLLSPYITGLFTLTMFFGGGLIPTYLLIQKLGMLDKVWAIVLPTSVSVFNMIVARTYFANSIPYELQESAKIDGCSDIYIFFKIVMPLSKAIVAVLALYYAVAMWNSYFSALIYISSRDKYPLQLVLREILFKNEALSSVIGAEDPVAADQFHRITQLIRYGLLIVASVPMFIAYPFVQKYFVKGVMIGSLKG